MSQTTSPFKFLDSYQQDDRDVFFGRDKEISDLYNALSGVKLLLVYGPSGSGKTSIIECGLRNQFSDADWFALTIRRGYNINASFFTSINEVLDEKIAVNNETKLPENEHINFGQAIEELFAERYQPVYLLLDQFEELLILGSEPEKKEFFNRLSQLIRYKVPCRVILIMREEFIGHLSEFEPLCPAIFQHRFRLEKMGKKNVKEVISRILDAPRYKSFFDVKNGEELCDTILQKLPDVKQEIELAHVQVFLGELWDRADKKRKQNERPLLEPGLVDAKDNLESVLEVFLKKQFSELEPVHGKDVTLELLAAMISERNTKLQMSEAELQADLDSKGVKLKKLSSLLDDLEDRRIIRTLRAGDISQYEISHDILASLVGKNRTEEMNKRERAQEIYDVYNERKGDFTEDDINYLLPYQQFKSFPSGLQQRVEESKNKIRQREEARKMEEEKKLLDTQKRLRVVRSLLAFAIVALIAAGFFGYNANRQKKAAVTAEAKALTEKMKADTALLNFQSEQAAKDSIQFVILESRFNTVIDAKGDPSEQIYPEMKTIVARQPNNLWMRPKLESLRNQCPNCK